MKDDAVLSPVQSPLISRAAGDAVRHGYFTRKGGVSDGIYAGLNVGLGSNDERERVVENRRRVGDWFGTVPARLATVHQAHSPDVVTVDDGYDGERPTADALVTATPGLVVAVLSADCGPVLFADPKAGVVGAAHAGWKGAAGGILYATVMGMVALGADPARIRAAIGPTISGANYEVGPDTARDIVALDSSAASHVSIPQGRTREHFDIPGLLAEQLFGAGVGLVGDLGICTYANPAKYFSHRYATHHGIATGRQIAVIGLR